MRGRALILAGTTSLLACAAGASAPVAPAAPSPCRIDAGEPADSVHIVLAGSIDRARLLRAREGAERAVRAQLYETLVRVDCAGRLVGALAASWVASPDGRTWTLTLRRDATFWDGSPVTAHAVAAGWTASTRAPLAWVSVAGERTLTVGLHQAATSPAFLADPALAVARRDSGTAWPIGTGPYRLDAAGASRLRLVLRDTTLRAPHVLHVAALTGGDLRGALDAGADALVARSTDVVAYARALPAYTVLPLPWSRTYVLAAARPSADAALPAPPEEALAALARDAAADGTRAAALGPCGDPAAQPRAAAGAGVPTAAFAYLRGDEVGRGLAERLAALAWPAERTPPWLRARLPRAAASRAPGTTALEARALDEALRARRYLGFVIDMQQYTSCDAPLAHDDARQRALRAGGLSITPLVDARDHLVYRRGLGTILLDADGTPRLGADRP